MTVDNLLKRGISKPEACVFCSDNESVNHLFFDCVVARKMWCYVDCYASYKIHNYESLACKWLHGQKSDCLNTISAGVLWGLWLSRNDMIFRNQTWQDIKTLLRRIWRCMLTWRLIFQGSLEAGVTQWCNFLEASLKAPL